ncbi:MAG: type II toxin-antitoxin system RelE family toxin [Candidatus Ranarchaeia archaeon]
MQQKIQELENFPRGSSIVKLTGLQNKYRSRVGNFRVLFELSNHTLIIFAVLHLKKAYRQLK